MNYSHFGENKEESKPGRDKRDSTSFVCLLYYLFCSPLRVGLSRSLHDEVQRLCRHDMRVLIRNYGHDDPDISQDDGDGIGAHPTVLARFITHLRQVAQVLHQLLVLGVVRADDSHTGHDVVDDDVQLGLLPPRNLQLVLLR